MGRGNARRINTFRTASRDLRKNLTFKLRSWYSENCCKSQHSRDIFLLNWKAENIEQYIAISRENKDSYLELNHASIYANLYYERK